MSLVICSTFLIAQEKTGEDYFRLAKKQKILGIGLLAAGAGTVWWGTTLKTKTKEAYFDLSNVGGHAAMLAGIVLLGAGFMVLGIKQLIISGKTRRETHLYYSKMKYYKK